MYSDTMQLRSSNHVGRYRWMMKTGEDWVGPRAYFRNFGHPLLLAFAVVGFQLFWEEILALLSCLIVSRLLCVGTTWIQANSRRSTRPRSITCRRHGKEECVS